LAVLRKLVPIYRSIASVSVGDGCRVSFWNDSWLPDGVLAVSRCAHFTHTTKPEATVAQVLLVGIDSILVPRLSTAGARERELLRPMIAAVTLRSEPDAHTLQRCAGPKTRSAPPSSTG
jgi:hypothetical protein